MDTSAYEREGKRRKCGLQVRLEKEDNSDSEC